jgi:DNA polymerase-3 subunit beta
MTVTRADLAIFVRFASRLASRAPMPALGCSLFSFESAVVTNLDVALRAHLPGARDIGGLIPVAVLKRCLLMRGASEVRIERVPSALERPFMFAVGGALFAGHDPAEFPGVLALFPTTEPIARAKFETLESVLVAASNDETRKSFCGVFFQLCKNLAVATNGHVLHTIEIESADRGDFLAPRKTVELVENIRKATKTPEVEVCFFEHQAVFRVGRFEIASRLETDKFPAWEEVLPKESKYELRMSKVALLDALDQIGAAVGDRSRGIRLRRIAEGLEIQGVNPDAGTMTTVVDASGWKEGETIGMSLAYFYSAARFASSDELRIRITDENSPLMIRDGPYFACVMPMRLKGDEQ